jgi:hypothetical protein
MTLPMAFCLVGIDPTEVPAEGEHHGSGYPTVVVVVVAVELICPGIYPATLGTLCLMGHRHSAVLGRTYRHPDLDRSGAGVPLAGPGALR